MAYYDQVWYISSVRYAAVTARPQNTAVVAGQLVRQFTAPAVNSERCFVCIVAGTTANVTDATWVLTRGAKTTDGTATWQECTGQPAVNGDLASTATWAQVKAVTPAVLGQIIKRSSGASYQICTTAGAMSASEPSFSDTAGVTTTDTTAVWTSLGPVGNFTAWGAPHARLANAYATNWGAAGNKFWLADNHAETQAVAMTLTNPATVAGGPTYTICVNRTAALPPVEANYNTGATISTTGSVTHSVSGACYYQGIAFSAGDAANSASITFATSANIFSLKNCSFKLNNTNAGSSILIGGSSFLAGVVWDNCTVQFGAVAQGIKLQSGNFEWKNTPAALQGAIIPTALFYDTAGCGCAMVCRGVDLSAFSGQLLASNQMSGPPLVFEDCKFHASMTRYGASSATGYAISPVITVRCDSGATNYKSTRDEYAGTQTTETSITRVGGATDGVTSTSNNIVTNAQASFLTPYRMLPLAVWNDVTGADVTVTVYGTINSASLPLNDELWMDVQYLGSSGSPIASFKTTSKSHPLAAGAAVAADGSTWNTATATVLDFTSLANTSLSSNGLVVTSTSGPTNDCGARTSSAALYNSGKFYFEAAVTNFISGAANGVGIALAATSYISMNTSAAGYNTINFVTGSIRTNGGLSGIVLGACVTGDVLGIAVDLDNRTMWYRKAPSGNWNNSGTANPATNTGGVPIPAGAMQPACHFGGSGSAANNITTVNFGATAFLGAVPSGFTSGWPSLWSAFKLVATLTSPQPAMKGYVYINVRAAKVSTAYYLDPLPTLT